MIGTFLKNSAPSAPRAYKRDLAYVLFYSWFFRWISPPPSFVQMKSIGIKQAPVLALKILIMEDNSMKPNDSSNEEKNRGPNLK